MKEYLVPVLKNAPITEALIDIRVKLPATTDVKSIDLLFEKIKNQYPTRQELRVSEVSFVLKPDEDPVKASKLRVNGYRYISADQKQIVQARLDGFTMSRLHPYTEWKDLRDEAKELWRFYKDITNPEAITRVALRYINNLNIPLPINDFADYLAAPPIVPDGLPQDVSSFLTRVIVPEPQLGANAIITQAFEPVAPEIKITRLPIILDIDVFKYDSQGMDEKEAWDSIEFLRHFKNKIFDKSITDRLKETYK
ncbi:MAG: TIGR04255 family protein [Proteobacteria bacterium]|nr:TIGR04255 family protein [Pseudomonadota bacterium]OQX00248.1 MAG: hypothetical protein BWK74_00095 [Desulfobacteraceae bacterium A6]